MKKSRTKLFWCAILGSILAAAMNGVADSPVQAVSLANPSIPAKNGGNSDSLGSVISADGRFVLFLSTASNLSTNDDDGGRFVDVFLRDRTNHTTTANDTNHYQDVFVRDLQTGTNIWVSVNSTGGGSANGFSGSPVMSANGRYVAFVSYAPDLIANKTNRNGDIFVRDLQTGTTTLVSASADGLTSGNADSSSPLISSDGRYVAFYSRAKNLVPNDVTRDGAIFWRDIQSGLTVSVTTNGNAWALLSLTADGRYVAAVAGSFFRELFVWDAQARAKIYATLSEAASYGFVLSPDGRTLIFQSLTNTNYAIMARDLVGGTDKVIGYSAIRGELKAQVSGNGRFVTFVSAANAPNTPNGTNNVFLYDLQTATTTLVSFNRDHTGGGNGASDSPSISADGRFVTYRSAASDLVVGDDNGQPDVFVFDRLSGINTLISVQQTGAGPGNAPSSAPVISADGSTIVFKSVASDLITDDKNGVQDVFVVHLVMASLADSDGDGMDDAWEIRNFGDLTHNGSGDSDGDGVSDWMESKMGTDPMNPASRFSPQAAVSPGVGQITITWQSAPGRSYRVEYKDDLSQTHWNDLSGGVIVTGSSAACWDTRAGTSNQRFYRIALVE